MKITGLRRGHCRLTVTRQKGDPRLRSESELFLRIRDALRAKGHDVIKKRMAKDGCLTAAHQYWVRSRNLSGFAIHHARYQLELAHEVYNREGRVELSVAWWRI